MNKSRTNELSSFSSDLKIHSGESEELLDFILDTTNIGYWEWDLVSQKQFFSSTFFKMLGYTHQEWKEKNLRIEQIIPEQDLEYATREFKRHSASRGQYPYNVKIRYLHRDGHFLFIWSRGKVVKFTDEGLPKLVRGTHVDISELTDYRQKLDDYSDRLTLIVKGINAGIWDWDLLEDKLWWSARFYQLLGYEENEMEASRENFKALLHPDEVEQVEHMLLDHKDDENPLKMEIRLKTREGKYLWFEVSGLHQLNEEGLAVRIVGSIININDRKTVEEEIHRNQYLLNEAGKIAKAGAWEIDLDTYEVSWSEEVYAIHELDEHITPTLENSAKHYPEKFRVKMRKVMQDAIEENRPFDAESQFITANKRLIWVRIAGYPVLDQLGKPKILRGILQDIDDLKNKENELQKSLDILAYQNKRLQNFAHIVSHNLRSHTGNIKMLLNFFERSDDEESKSEVLKNIYKVSDQLDKTIYHLNEIVEEKVDLDKDLKLLNFEEVLRQTLEVLEGSIRDQNVKISYDFNEAPEVNFMRPYLDSLFLNLLSNAIKYRHKKRDPVISIKSYNDQGDIKLEITDNGSGIDLNRYGSKVFGMYKTFHKNADARGLGLFLTKNQVEATGGTIDIESTAGKGTKFIISFRKQH